MNETTMLCLVGLILFAVLLFEVLIGIYVYRDAKKRSMNALLWTLVAVFAPSLIGFIVYLVVRSNYSNLKCSKCGAAVTEQYVICPQCGAKLKPSCPNCSNPVKSDWKLCPKCASPLPEQYDDIISPLRPKDKILRKILLILIIVPLLIIVLAICGMVAYTANFSSGYLCIVETDLASLYDAQETSDVQTWLESRDENGEAYALQYATETSEGDDLYYYLLYMPGDKVFIESEKTNERSASAVFQIYFKEGTPNEQKVFCIELSSEKVQGLEVYVDSQKLNCEIMVVDYNPVQNIILSASEDDEFSVAVEE